MAPIPPMIISPLLKDTTELKIEELNREREAFRTRYFGKSDAEQDPITRISALLEHMKTQDPDLEEDDDFEVIERLVEQAKNDPTVSAAQLQKYEKQLRDKRDLELRRLDTSAFHGVLLKQTLHAATLPPAPISRVESAALDDGFELVEDQHEDAFGQLEAAYHNFERSTFTEKDVDEKALEEYLNGLFDSKAGKDALETLRDDVGDVFTAETYERITEEIVEWCIKDLVDTGLHSEKTRGTLQEYLQNPPALRELKGAIQIKAIRHWNWRKSSDGLPVTARQDADGKYRITIEEDLVDMVFLHIVAVHWSTKIKSCLRGLVSDMCIWPRSKNLTTDEVLIRDYYLFASPPPPPKIESTICTVCHPPPPPPPMPVVDIRPPPPPGCGIPPPPPPGIRGKSKKLKSSKRRSRSYMSSGLDEERHSRFINNFFLARLPSCGDDTPEVTPTSEIQGKLLNYLATEINIRKGLDGEAHAFGSSFPSLPSSLSHKTILTVLKFIGVHDRWLEIFTRFLKAPLNVGPVEGSIADQVLTRACGVPYAHGFERLFSETVLFFLDFAVHQGTGTHLFRLGHSAYFVGNKYQYDVAKATTSNFARVMGLDLELDVDSIGFMKLDSAGPSPKLTLDTAQIEQYAYRTKKQLTTCNSVLEWVRMWNDTIGTYAAHLFGPLANVFGKEHLDRVTEEYQRIYKIIFEKSSLTDHVKRLLAPHLKPSMRAPDFNLEPLIYLPTAYGGLGVKNPFITFNIARHISENPESRVENYLEAEKTYHTKYKAWFDGLGRETAEKKLLKCFDKDKEHIARAFGKKDPSEFMPFEDFVAMRERRSYPNIPGQSVWAMPPMEWTPAPSLFNVYNPLLHEPTDDIESTMKICDAVRDCAGRNGMKYWRNLSGDEKWVLMMYGEEVMEKFGGLEMWKTECVPREALMLVRGEEHMFDDEDSCSDYSV